MLQNTLLTHKLITSFLILLVSTSIYAQEYTITTSGPGMMEKTFRIIRNSNLPSLMLAHKKGAER